MKLGRSQHRSVQIRNGALIVGNYFAPEIFKTDHTFSFVSPCPIKAIKFGFTNKNDSEVYLYSQD